jgi:hypothetical protein
MLIVSVILKILFLCFLGAFFYVITNEVFVVTFNSGIWWFALLLYLLLVAVDLWLIFHPTNQSVRVKVVTAFTLIAVTAVIIYLGIEYEPFRNIKVNEKLGAFFTNDSVDGVLDVDNLPEPLKEIQYKMPSVLEQGDCGSCWAYAGAAALSANLIFNSNNSSKDFGYSCTFPNTKIKGWEVSPQSLIDLGTEFTVGGNKFGKCNGDYSNKGLILGINNETPTGKCIPSYSSKYSGSINSCPSECGSEKSKDCLLSQTLSKEYNKCANGKITDKKRKFQNKKVLRIPEGENAMLKAISKYGPVLVWISMYPDGSYPAWTLQEKSLFGSNKIVSNGFVAKPSMDRKRYTIDRNGVGHVVVAYGYGELKDGTKYWKCQNSWSSKWGQKGSIKIQRGVNAWGIESEAYAIV